MNVGDDHSFEYLQDLAPLNRLKPPAARSGGFLPGPPTDAIQGRALGISLTDQPGRPSPFRDKTKQNGIVLGVPPVMKIGIRIIG